MLKSKTTLIAAISLAILVALGLRGLTAPRAVNGQWQRLPEVRSGAWALSPPAAQKLESQHSTPARVVNAKQGGRLKDLLRADDRVVEVQRLEHFYVGGKDDPLEELRFLTQHSEAVVTLEARDLRSQLSKNEDWVESTMTGEIVEVLKNTGTFLLSPGTLLSLPYEGGEVQIDGKTVRARANPTDHPQVGHRYLYFLFDDAGELRPMPPIHTFELRGQSIRRLTAQGTWGLDKGILDTSTVLESIRSMANLPTVRVPR
jgi:hypothetical protein